MLDRTTDMVQQYLFSFGNQFNVYDNRAQAFLLEGIAAIEGIFPADTNLFSLLFSIDTSIRDEELYYNRDSGDWAFHHDSLERTL